ncbi:YdeI/OmpD-associated family protein [Pseudonocardia sp. TRM90224]|uniref:YdeI/OmpD-associated family protein n=1 Tax=Pseudonocardia sp. TRM90224 TaxID=2812678 RepID=UPI001E63AA37|nr:YdeI/OmpD-associated family protein [Pseudonocardia sp. TRM90224]
MKFRATLQLNGRTATGFQVPPEVVDELGSGKRPAVVVTINDAHSYRSTVAVMSGAFMLGVSATNRAEAGVEAGDVIDVELQLDTAPREVSVPDDLAAALDADCRRAFDSLSYSNRQRHVLAVEGAKTAATRERRIAAVVATMRAAT